MYATTTKFRSYVYIDSAVSHTRARAHTHTQEVISMVDAKNKDNRVEMEDRIRRKTNLVMFRAPEETDLPIKERKTKDSTFVKDILEEIKTEHKPIDVRRLGTTKSDPDNDPKPRPIRMTFPTEAARDEVLAAFHKTRKRKDENTKCSKVSIRKDLTPLERKEEGELFQELKSKREDSEKVGDHHAHWVRTRGGVVNIGKYPVGQEQEQSE